MKPEQQHIAIAEVHLGFDLEKMKRKYQTESVDYFLNTPPPDNVPNYTGCLNAMHEAEKVLTNVQQDIYTTLLCANKLPQDTKHACWLIAHATAAQRAEAFLRTVGKWKD